MKFKTFFERPDVKKAITFYIQSGVIFAITFTILLVMGFVPTEFTRSKSIKKSPTNDVSDVASSTDTSDDFVPLKKDEAPLTQTKPERITIAKIGVDSYIQAPQSQNVSALDQALQKGAVYYPGSGTIEKGNIFLFGHSTNWKIVNNQAYKTFNDLDKLEEGDEITLEADGYAYIYSVTDVTLVNDDEGLVEFNNSGRTLTISTCNTFGAKQERWVVDAVFKRRVAI